MSTPTTRLFRQGILPLPVLLLLACSSERPPAAEAVGPGGGGGNNTLTDGGRLADGGARTDGGALASITQVANGDHHACALKSDGKVLCWGDNRKAQLAVEKTLAFRNVPAVVTLPRAATSIAAGADHTCAVLAGGEVYCWGENAVGQLGNGKTDATTSAVSAGQIGAAQIAAKGQTSCAVTTGGGALCWGNNVAGQLGDGTIVNRSVPTAVAGLATGVRQIAPGGQHTCALLSDGSVVCWGDNANGAFGNSDTVSSPTFVVSDLTNGVDAIASGLSFSCALTSAKAVLCWGFGGRGQLGNGASDTEYGPVAVTGLGSGVKAIALGTTHGCAINGASGLVCWGSNLAGELGNGTPANSPVPVAIASLATNAGSAALGLGTCAVTTGGAAFCWGANDRGQVGDGTNEPRLTPAPVVP